MAKLKIGVDPDDSETKRSRSRSKKTLIVILVLLTPFLLLGGWVYINLNGFGAAGKNVTIEVKSGSGTREIGELLQTKKIIRSGNAFALYTKLASKGPYQAGQYKLSKNIGIKKAIEILEKGPTVNYDQFTILPGERYSSLENKVDALPKMSKEELNNVVSSGKYHSKFSPEGSNNLEGLLLPETYSISENETEEDLIRRSIQEFDAQATNAGLSGNKNGLTPYELIIVASLIEKEARYAQDRPLIASVIYNRLEIDMRLQIDAAVLYGLNKTSGLKSDELKRDTPYNTYTRNGLVPTPISMISMDSLRAALNPADTKYLYYVLSDSKTGKHAFSENYEGHLKNIEAAKKSGDL